MVLSCINALGTKKGGNIINRCYWDARSNFMYHSVGSNGQQGHT